MKENYKDIVVNHYSNYEEDLRFDRRAQSVEYMTTMRYIKKHLKKGAKILEVGAGTGKYSIALANLGYDVTAIDLTPKNIEVLKKNAEGIKNIHAEVGDALNLGLPDNAFDMVLNLGPMYHLYKQKDKDKAIAETIRVCKPNGVCMFAYLTHAAIVWAYGVRKNCFGKLEYALDKAGRIKDVPKEVFSSFHVDEFKKQFEKTNTTYITNVATDGLFPMMRDYIDQMSEEDFAGLLKYHYNTCEREDIQGNASHLLYICRKNKV